MWSSGRTAASKPANGSSILSIRAMPLCGMTFDNSIEILVSMGLTGFRLRAKSPEKRAGMQRP